jgi:hypothetical protein
MDYISAMASGVERAKMGKLGQHHMLTLTLLSHLYKKDIVSVLLLT